MKIKTSEIWNMANSAKDYHKDWLVIPALEIIEFLKTKGLEKKE